ncbi:MAG: sulfur carrier protein ThiS [Bacteroidales bacterium]|nr:sulfur carrier protein ThiS [Bacteroidales bacterium]
MIVLVNGKDTNVTSGCTLEKLCETIGIKPNEPVAVAIGTDVIDRNMWDATILNEGDKVTIIRATCGG